MTALADIEAASKAARLQLAEYLKPRLEAARDALQASPVVNLVADLDAVRAEMPEGEDKTQLGNVIVVLTSVPSFLASRIVSVDADIAAAASAEE